MQSACFISLRALLSCGALERARSSLKLASEHKAFCQEAWESVSWTCFGALGANAFRPLGRDLGMPKGSRGGIWAIRPSAGTAQAARPPLLGLLWSGSSRETINRCDSPNEDVQVPKAPVILTEPLSQGVSEGTDARFVPSDLRITLLASRLIYRPAPP